MTRKEDTLAAIEVLREALARCTREYKHGTPAEALVKLWNAAGYLQADGGTK